MAEPMSNVSPNKLNTAQTYGIRSSPAGARKMSSPAPAHSTHSPLPARDDTEGTSADLSWHEPPSSPFISHVDPETVDQENIAPTPSRVMASTPQKDDLIDWDDESVPQSTFKAAPASPSKTFGLKERSPAKASPVTGSPAATLLEGFDENSFRSSPHAEGSRSPKKTHAPPMKHVPAKRPGSAMSQRSFNDTFSPVKSTHRHSPPFEFTEPGLRDNEGLTVAIKQMNDAHVRHEENYRAWEAEDEEIPNEADMPNFGALEHMEDLQRVQSFGSNGSGADGLDSSSIDDTRFSTFSEMPNLDMTKFAFLKSPTKSAAIDTQATPRASRSHMTPSTVRRSDRTPSPTPRAFRYDNGEANAGDTTNLILDFTAQLNGLSSLGRPASPSRDRRSPLKSGTEPNLLSYMKNQRSPAKGSSSQVQSTPSRTGHLLNLLDFELPPPPTPRSVPTVTIREMESLKSSYQSQISSLTASLSGKEAEVDSLVKAVSSAERRVGEAHELVREERSKREHAEAQMADWKHKGEEVQTILEEVQSELARNDSERDALLSRIAQLEKRCDDAEQRASDLEHRAIEAESKNVDMTTFINPDGEDKKIYSEAECQTAIEQRVNEVAKELHSAYKAKHEKKIKALKETYQNKAEAKTKELRLQIGKLERKLEETQRAREKDDTFTSLHVPSGSDTITAATSTSPSKTRPCDACAQLRASNAAFAQDLEHHAATIETLRANLAGLESQLSSLRSSHASLLSDLEAERVEKGELVAAAEQMLALCGEKMEEMQHQEEMRKSQMGGGPPRAPSRGPDRAPEPPSMRATGFLGGAPPGPRPGSGMGQRLGAMGGGASERTPAAARPAAGKPSGLRAPGGFGYGGGKSRLMNNIERMGGRGGE